ncbi:hypothetical protein BB560_004372 [Smittium megazygosporum]|uniref:Malic enzyme n=1 Tax=Smittium megazygosporum TaxID=133381 RepID=A0A2T9Z9H2_9FUNG|nr:hypothetical protein BB560_004372 [Smittium megazygosporum]
MLFFRARSFVSFLNKRSLHSSLVSTFKTIAFTMSSSFPGQGPISHDTFSSLERKAYKMLASKTSALDKYIFLASIRNSNPDLFFSIVLDNLTEIAPIIYTPTIGDVCLKYSDIYPFISDFGKPNGLYITLEHLENIDTVLENYKQKFCQGEYSPEISVITDGSRILGLGDLGLNGMGIPIGKLQLYIAGAGLNPKKCLPIILDFGTNNKKYLDDPDYLGLRQPRLKEDEYFADIEIVLVALKKAFPNMFIQFEDFSTSHAIQILEKYRNKILSFNDDIQGTGSVITAGFINAVRLSKTKLPDHRILFSGAGSAAVGVAQNLIDYFVIIEGVPAEHAKKMFWFIDSKGLITTDRGDKLAPHKVAFARSDNNGVQYKTLEETLEYVKPTALIGLSTVKDQFSPEIISRMTEMNPHNKPIIFALSNPMSKAECSFESAMVNSKYQVIYASGTEFPPFTIPETGEVRLPDQGNNMYIFPAIGLAAVLSKPKMITDSMIHSISKSLSDSLNQEETDAHHLYPNLKRLREVSANLTAAMIHQAVIEGQVSDQFWIDMTASDPEAKNHWNPEKPDGYCSPKVVDYVSKKMWKPTRN